MLCAITIFKVGIIYFKTLHNSWKDLDSAFKTFQLYTTPKTYYSCNCIQNHTNTRFTQISACDGDFQNRIYICNIHASCLNILSILNEHYSYIDGFLTFSVYIRNPCNGSASRLNGIVTLDLCWGLQTCGATWHRSRWYCRLADWRARKTVRSTC